MSALDSRLVCRGCGAELAPDDPHPLRCPRAGTDGGEHVLRRHLDLAGQRFPALDDENPFVAFRALLHAYRLARRRGMADSAFIDLVREVDDAVRDVDGVGFHVTPCTADADLAAALGLDRVLVKDETGNVAHSHKARHLMGLALHLHVIGGPPGRLAIASCGNAALAAAVLARANGWTLETYVPTDADPEILARLESLGARLVRCDRGGETHGDPCFERFRAAVHDGAYPFTCQGTENGLTIEGGETLSWELIAQQAALGTEPLDALVVQVGGGALACAQYTAFEEALALGAIERLPRLFTVQTEASHPLERAWREVARVALEHAGAPPPETDADLALLLAQPARADAVRSALDEARRDRARFMRAWDSEPRSLATGILDDETYDWLALVEAMIRTGGRPVVVDETEVREAWDLGRETGRPVGPTGTAGLAGLRALAADGTLDPATRAAVLFTGRW